MAHSQWQRLKSDYDRIKNTRILELFQAHPSRFHDFSIQADGLLFDYSKTKIDNTIRDALLELAETRGVFEKRTSMFKGEAINTTEERAVLHTALRAPHDAHIALNGEDIVKGIHETLENMCDFTHKIRSKALTSSNGQAFSDVINIGIGGSDLGPQMAVKALSPYHDGPNIHFISNVDSADVADCLKALDPHRTLVIIASKTFTTIETMTNAQTVKEWLLKSIAPDNLGEHLVALSTARGLATDFGVLPTRIFGFEDWVGGRYSLWGPIGLSIMLAIGEDNFKNFLKGARAMDAHFCEAKGAGNIPLMLALIGIWHNNICGYETRALLPYDNRLARLPAYVQQLDMESNGKSVAENGASLERHSGPIIWGEPGTNGQHAFYQLIHQGTRIIPCEFLIAKRNHEPHLKHHHELLLANCFAQSEALMIGRSFEEARAMLEAKGLQGDALKKHASHRVFEGDRPSTTLLYETLTPYSLGQIIALYEHRVFVEGVIWGINSFDQWGVELGKSLALDLLPLLKGEGESIKDGSTLGLVEYVKE